MKLKNKRDFTKTRGGFWTNNKTYHNNVSWVCPFCSRMRSVTWGGPMCYIDLGAFDAAVNLWIDGCTAGMAAKLSA